MQDKIIEFMLSGADWLSPLKETISSLDAVAGTRFLEKVLIIALQKDASIPDLDDLITYHDQRGT